MARGRGLYLQIAEPDNLRLAFRNAVKGKADRHEVIAYRQNLDDNLANLRNLLLNGNLPVGPYRFFTMGCRCCRVSTTGSGWRPGVPSGRALTASIAAAVGTTRPRTRGQLIVTTIRPTIATTILASALLPQLTGQVDTARWTGRHPAPNQGKESRTPAAL